MTTKAKESKKVPVSKRALEARVRRALERDGLVLRKFKVGSKWFEQYGEYYLTDERNNEPVFHQDLETLAKEYEVIRPFEALAYE